MEFGNLNVAGKGYIDSSKRFIATTHRRPEKDDVWEHNHAID